MILFLSVMKLETKYGTISLKQYIIAQVVEKSVLESYGVVALSTKSVKNKLMSFIKRNSSCKGVSVAINDDGTVDLKVHIIVEYGVSIPEVTKSLVERIRYDLSKLLGVQVNNIEVVVEGVKD